MSTTIRIDESDKDRLRRLAESWHRATGERPSMQELLAQGLAFLERHREQFLAERAWQPPDARALRRLRSKRFSFEPVAVEDIDAIVYDRG